MYGNRVTYLNKNFLTYMVNTTVIRKVMPYLLVAHWPLEISVGQGLIRTRWSIEKSWDRFYKEHWFLLYSTLRYFSVYNSYKTIDFLLHIFPLSFLNVGRLKPKFSHTFSQFSNPGNKLHNIGWFYCACRGWIFFNIA